MPEPMPDRVAPFQLDVDQLERIATQSGLQWIGSDAQKVAAAQAAIAAEPAAIHVPRQRKPLPPVDAGPLILVETARDLAQMRLPFESATRDAQAADANTAEALNSGR